MSTPKPLPTIPEGLIYQDHDALQAKIFRFMDASASKVHFILDFDRTLTVRHPSTDADITSWIIMSEHLSPKSKRIFQDLYLKYRPKEIANEMTTEDAVDWWSTVLDMFVAEKLDLAAIERDFLSRVNQRPGATELFGACEKDDIPRIVLSAGVREIIEFWGKVYASPPSLTVATELEVDFQNRITGWRKESLVHTLNKSEADHAELRKIRIERPFAIVVGDSLHDADMAEGEDTVLRVRILDPRSDEKNDLEQERLKTFEHFDAIIENGTLQPLIDLTKMILS